MEGSARHPRERQAPARAGAPVLEITPLEGKDDNCKKGLGAPLRELASSGAVFVRSGPCRLERIASCHLCISRPLVAIYIWIHPNELQHSQSPSFQYTVGLLYLSVALTKHPSSESRLRHFQRIYRRLIS